MTSTKFFQSFYRCSSLLGLMQIEGIFFIDSFDVTFQKHMFNISRLLNTAKIEKKVRIRSKPMKHSLTMRKYTTGMDVIKNGLSICELRLYYTL